MQLHTEQIAARAAAIADADVVLQMPAPGEPARCMLCSREASLAVVVLLKSPAMGATVMLPDPCVGVCAECRDAAGESRRAAVADLVQTASRADSILQLIRHRADRQLTEWWGAVGACSAEDVDDASVSVRRSIERLGAGR